MKAMILAAGLGTRLRPLTDAIAKPMIPVVNKPVMEHVIELLARQGITELYANVHYKADEIIEHFGNGKKWGVSLKYSYEESLCGTAGGVKRMESFLSDDTFLVFSGDLLTDLDLEPLVSAHRAAGALATLALTRVSDPTPYGVVVVDGTGRIVSFKEKPAGLSAGNLINCGVYLFEPEIFDLIPAETEYDFGRDLFPLLREMNAPLFGVEHSSYWLDIGRIESYLKGNFDALTGNVKIQVPGQNIAEGIWVGQATEIHHSAQMTGPLCIGSDCVIRRNARLIGPAIIGNNNIINEGTVLRETIKLPNGFVEKDLSIVGGVVGDLAATGSLPLGRF
jgi:NDP-sugar pyrophosphorylase family protein